MSDLCIMHTCTVHLMVRQMITDGPSGDGVSDLTGHQVRDLRVTFS